MITATFTQGLDEMTALGLTQWDYGQKLEIRGLTLPATFQVHFACKRTSEAMVRLGVNSAGVGTVAIPDGLLEQDTPIIARIYEVGKDSGETIKAVRLPVTPRLKPQDQLPEQLLDARAWDLWALGAGQPFGALYRCQPVIL